MRRQRGCEEVDEIVEKNSFLTNSSIWIFIGWVLHYLPFYGMGRVLYFHHYFPAALFSSMLSAVILDYLFQVIPFILIPSLSIGIYHWLYGSLLSSVFYSFYLFSPLSYGMPNATSTETNSTMHGLKWLESWEF